MTTTVKYFQTKRCEIMDLTYLAQDRDQGQVLANMLMNFHVIRPGELPPANQEEVCSMKSV
jgi:hypothetical protein